MSQSGAVANYRCSSYYELHGSPVQECLISGEWSGIKPVCLRKSSLSNNNITVIHFLMLKIKHVLVWSTSMKLRLKELTYNY